MSVIVPTFNRRAVLERALNSVVRQTFQDWELIVIDDGSTDGTIDFVNAWASGQKFTQPLRMMQTPNAGVSRARNRGAKLAVGPWLAFLDSDDEWLSDKLEKQFKLTPHYSVIHGEEVWVRRGTRVNPMKKHAKSGGRIFSRCVDLCCISPSTVMLNHELFQREGGFREDFAVCEDYEFWLRLSSRYEVGFVNTPLIIKYGGHPDQLSLTHKAMDFLRLKGLQPFLRDRHLSHQEREHVAETMLRKADILLKGYQKHAHPTAERTVHGWRDEALNALTQFQRAHSATERFPRSVPKLRL